MNIKAHVKQAHIVITDDAGKVALEAQVEDYKLELDTENFISAIDELITKSKDLAAKL